MVSPLASWYSFFFLLNSSSAFWAVASASASDLSCSGRRCSGVTLSIVKLWTMPSSVGEKATVAILPSVPLSRSLDAWKYF